MRVLHGLTEREDFWLWSWNAEELDDPSDEHGRAAKEGKTGDRNANPNERREPILLDFFGDGRGMFRRDLGVKFANLFGGAGDTALPLDCLAATAVA